MYVALIMVTCGLIDIGQSDLELSKIQSMQNSIIHVLLHAMSEKTLIVELN